MDDELLARDVKEYSLIKEYSDVGHSVLFIYDLRFKIATLYVFGMLSSLAISLQFMNPIGLMVGIGATGAMSILDFILHCRQTLFSFKSAELEQVIYKMRKDADTKTPYGAYTLYFNTFWNLKKEFGQVSFDDIQKNGSSII